MITTRQEEVLVLVVDGKTNAAIAQCLRISQKTVEKHLARIFAALGVHSRLEAAMHAQRCGLLENSERSREANALEDARGFPRPYHRSVLKG